MPSSRMETTMPWPESPCLQTSRMFRSGHTSLFCAKRGGGQRAPAWPGPPRSRPSLLTMYHCLENQGSVGTARERFTRRRRVCCSNHRTWGGMRAEGGAAPPGPARTPPTLLTTICLGGPHGVGRGLGPRVCWVPMCLGTCPCTPPSGHSLYYPQRRAGHVLHTHLLPVLPLPALPLVSSLLKSSHGSPPPSPGPTAPCLSVPHQPLSAVAAAATSPGPLHMLCLPGAALPPSWLICPLSPRTSSCLPPPCQQSGPVSPHWLCSHLESRPLIISLCPTRLTRGQALASCQPRLQPAPLLCCHPSRGASNSQAFSFLNPLLAHTPW